MATEKPWIGRSASQSLHWMLCRPCEFCGRMLRLFQLFVEARASSKPEPAQSAVSGKKFTVEETLARRGRASNGFTSRIVQPEI